MADENNEVLEQEPHGSNGAADELTEWKASSRKWEELAKKNKNAAKELEELKRQLAESQEAAAKATAEADELKAKAERDGWIKEASKATGVPVEALHGSTKEEVDALAESLKGYFAKPSAPVVNTGNPSADEGVKSADPLRALLEEM